MKADIGWDGRDRGRPITSIESLRERLQWAVELEHSTLPPYLCALYSLDPATNPDAVEVVRSVLIEEMLHLALVANLLNAVGGEPVLDSPRLLRPFPGRLPHSDPALQVSLCPFSRGALELFLRIEHPRARGTDAQDDCYETIGQFYQSIRDGLSNLCQELGEDHVFSGDRNRQLIDDHFGGGPGRLVAATDLDEGLCALDLIVAQGEGTEPPDPSNGELDLLLNGREGVPHYYRFLQLELGRRYAPGDTPITGPTGDRIVIDWDAVRPMGRNPRCSHHEPGSPVRTAMERFNTTYCTLLRSLEQVFNGQPERLGPAIHTMFGLKGMAESLMEMPIGDGSTTAGPTFEYVPPGDRR